MTPRSSGPASTCTAKPPDEIIDDLDPPGNTVAFLLVDGQWYASRPEIGPNDLPSELRTPPTGPVPATSVTIGGEPFLVAGQPLGDGTVFYEVAPLRGLRSALEVVSRTLIACGIAATVAAALVGLWASRRLLRPLRQLADTAVQVADGQLDIRVPAARDVELAMIDQSVNRMVDSLQQRIERERRFFGDVSHELRTPLTTLVTAVGVLHRHRDALPTRAGQAFDLVETEVNHLRRLLDHLLALARAEAGLHQDEVEALSVGDLLTHALADSGRPADLLTVDEDTVINGRKLSLERAFVNLIDNADRHGGGLMSMARRPGRASGWHWSPRPSPRTVDTATAPTAPTAAPAWSSPSRPRRPIRRRLRRPTERADEGREPCGCVNDLRADMGAPGSGSRASCVR